MNETFRKQTKDKIIGAMPLINGKAGADNIKCGLVLMMVSHGWMLVAR